MMQHIDYNICVYELLDGRYPHILSSMLGESFFIIQDKVYDFFYEVTYFNSVVGFICGSFEEDMIICELAYILPKFRNLGLFCSGLRSLDNLFDNEVVLFLPNHYVILSLLHNDLAFKLDDDLIISKFRLCFYRCDSGVRVFSVLYDLFNCCVVSLSGFVVSPLLDVDVFSLGIDRCIGDEYFLDMKSRVLGLL